jgi:hypothetical protein
MDSNTQQPPTDVKPTEATPAQATVGANASEIRFTSAALEERLDRERKSAVTGLLTELGLKDADTLKAALADLSKLKEASMTDAEKAVAAKADLEARLAQEAERTTLAQKAVEAAQAELRQERLTAAIMRAANVRYPDDVVVWSQRPENAELLKKSLSAEGKPDEAGIKALVEACQKARPEWFGARSGPGTPSNAGAKPPKRDSKDRIVKKIAY